MALVEREVKVAPTSDPTGQSGAPVVAIVEDQQAIAELLSEVLTAAGFAPVRAPAAGAAAGFVRDVGAKVVLLDVMMPELSGWSVLEQLRADPATRETPVVIISAVYDRPGLHSIPPGGPVRFAAKPFDVAELLATITNLLA